MVVVGKDSGEKFVPPGHDKMEARKLFGPENGSSRAAIHFSTLQPGGGMSEEIHEHEDQVFYVLSGSINLYSGGQNIGDLETGDGVHVKAGEPHAFRNVGRAPCALYILTVPPISRQDKDIQATKR